MIKSPGTANEVFTSYHNLNSLNEIQVNEQTQLIQQASKNVGILEPLVICGPSGTGKTTLLKRLMMEFEELFGFSISHTTRNPRSGEIDGKDYHFIKREEMERRIDNDEFIETAEFSGNYYGTSKRSVKNVQSQGKICILDVDIKGVFSLKQTDLNPKCILIKPPSLAVLEQRLRERGTETEEKIKLRLKRAIEEINISASSLTWDHKIVNDDLDRAYEQLKMFVKQAYAI